MISPALPTDIDAIAALGAAFHAEHATAALFPYDIEYVKTAITGLRHTPNAALWVATDDWVVVGVLVGVLTSVLFNPNVCVAEEIIWYVHPDHRTSTHGLRLLITFEQWAKAHNASHIFMTTHAQYPGVENIYIARDYSVHETRYVKTL